LYKNNVLGVVSEGSPNRQAHIWWKATAEAEAKSETKQNKKEAN
jgi:hypothetical protein